MIVNNAMFSSGMAYSTIAKMNEQLGQLQQQLATGKRAQSLSELGSGRIVDLTLRARLAAMDAYSETITTVGLRLELMTQAMTRMDGLEAEIRADVHVGSRDVDGTNLPTAQFLAKNRLSEAIDLLNTQVNGRFLFAGNTTENRPVALFDEMMNGKDGRAGFRQVMAERLQADLGASGLGRVSSSLAATTVSLSEDGVHPFGFKLSSLAATGGAVTLTGPAGSPATMDIDFAAQPAAGDTVLIGLGMPDGTTRTLTFTATTDAPFKAGQFQIGTTAADTAANFEIALNGLLAEKAGTELTAASGFAAAGMFFAGTGGTAMRVDGPPFDSATGLVAATQADTVSWYRGQDGPVPRATVTARIDDSSTVAYGVQANEEGLVEMIRSLAVLASDSVSPTAANARGFYAAANMRAGEHLSEENNATAGSVEGIVMDLALAQTAIGRAQERHDLRKVSLESMLSEIEDIPPEEVAMMLMALQTRLQASYQTMSIVSKLSLVNYLG